MRVCRKEGTFDVRVGLRQGWVMSQWLCNLFIEGGVREWKAKLMNAGICFE